MPFREGMGLKIPLISVLIHMKVLGKIFLKINNKRKIGSSDFNLIFIKSAAIIEMIVNFIIYEKKLFLFLAFHIDFLI